jgi:hypothetical protein
LDKTNITINTAIRDDIVIPMVQKHLGINPSVENYNATYVSQAAETIMIIAELLVNEREQNKKRIFGPYVAASNVTAGSFFEMDDFETWRQVLTTITVPSLSIVLADIWDVTIELNYGAWKLGVRPWFHSCMDSFLTLAQGYAYIDALRSRSAAWDYLNRNRMPRDANLVYDKLCMPHDPVHLLSKSGIEMAAILSNQVSAGNSTNRFALSGSSDLAIPQNIGGNERIDVRSMWCVAAVTYNPVAIVTPAANKYPIRHQLYTDTSITECTDAIDEFDWIQAVATENGASWPPFLGPLATRTTPLPTEEAWLNQTLARLYEAAVTGWTENNSGGQSVLYYDKPFSIQGSIDSVPNQVRDILPTYVEAA